MTSSACVRHEIIQHFHSDASLNRFQYSNPEVDAMIEAALVEPDESTRMQMYCDIQMQLMEDVAAAWTFHVGYFAFGFPPYVQGVEQSFWRVIDPRFVWLDQE